MSKKIFNLPDDFIDESQEIFLHFYATNQNSVKNRVVFSRNVFSLLLEGEKEAYVKTSYTKIGKDKFLLIRKGTSLMTEKLLENNWYKSILLFFSNAALLDFCLRYHVSLDKDGSDIESDYMLVIEKDDFVLNYENSFKILEDEKLRKDEQLLKVKFDEIMLFLLKKYPQQITPFIQNALNENDNHEFKSTVLQHIDEGLTVEELAFLCNMSLSSFKRKFNDVFENSPGKYITESKMKKAKKLLLQDRRPSEVYFELGYKNLSSFSNEFKKYFGTSPKLFQVENRASSVTY
ncbi:MAG: AraC family transcriptional regulator [Thalassobius sp.]|nr:AraC family transcriptional regulator [Thalassovita sp.]